MILNHRTLAKLKSTYADALVELVHPQTGRIHTSFNQTVTATGRLSSSGQSSEHSHSHRGGPPNSRHVHSSGRLADDFGGLFSDRAAHFCPLFRGSIWSSPFRTARTFMRTAAEVLNVPSMITPELRRRARLSISGIIYGMGPFGLSKA